MTPLWRNEKFHTAIEYSLFVHKNSKSNDYEFDEIFDYRSANYDNIKNKLNTIDWQTILRSEKNVENAVDVFYNYIYKIIHEEVPIKKRRRQNHSKNPVWYNKEIKNLKNRKQKAHKIHKTQNNQDTLAAYLDICDRLNLALKLAFEEYNRKTELEIKSCPKFFFNYVKSKLKSDNFPSKMCLDEKESKNSQDISNLFADFFREIYTTFSEADRDREYFGFYPKFPSDVCVSQENVQDILTTLQNLDSSKGPGPDEIPPIFMKTLATELTSPLFWIFNMSLESGCFPKIWKSSYLVPIFKSGKKVILSY